MWDIKTSVALEVLFRALQEGAAAPLRQRYI